MRELVSKPKGVLVFVDPDKEIQKTFKKNLKELKMHNQLVCCYNGEEALLYLKDTEDKIFMILSEISMPKIDGLELKRIIEMTPELKTKAIPFFYYTQVDLQTVIKTAYSFGIQGYFKKSSDNERTIQILIQIFNLWTMTLHPKDLK